VPEPRAFGNGSGGVLSSAHDMAAWLLMQGQRGRGPGWCRDRFTRFDHDDADTVTGSGAYALGWTIGETASGSPMLSHSGDLFTSTAQQLLLTDTGWGVAVMANTGLVHGHARDIATRIVAVIEGGQVPSVSFWPQVLIDVVMLAFTAVIIAQAAREVRRSHIWGTPRARLWIQLARILPLLAPLLVCGTIHRVVGFLFRGATWRGSRCRISIEPSWCCWLPQVSAASQYSALVSPGWRLLGRLIPRELLRIGLMSRRHDVSLFLLT